MSMPPPARINQLPNEVLDRCFSYLRRSSLLRASLVCHEFKDHAQKWLFRIYGVFRCYEELNKELPKGTPKEVIDEAIISLHRKEKDMFIELKEGKHCNKVRMLEARGDWDWSYKPAILTGKGFDSTGIAYFEAMNAFVDCLPSFTMLTSLTLARFPIINRIGTNLRLLVNLRHLSLIDCFIHQLDTFDLPLTHLSVTTEVAVKWEDQTFHCAKLFDAEKLEHLVINTDIFLFNLILGPEATLEDQFIRPPEVSPSPTPYLPNLWYLDLPVCHGYSESIPAYFDTSDIISILGKCPNLLELRLVGTPLKEVRPRLADFCPRLTTYSGSWCFARDSRLLQKRKRPIQDIHIDTNLTDCREGHCLETYDDLREVLEGCASVSGLRRFSCHAHQNALPALYKLSENSFAQLIAMDIDCPMLDGNDDHLKSAFLSMQTLYNRFVEDLMADELLQDWELDKEASADTLIQGITGVVKDNRTLFARSYWELVAGLFTEEFILPACIESLTLSCPDSIDIPVCLLKTLLHKLGRKYPQLKEVQIFDEYTRGRDQFRLWPEEDKACLKTLTLG
ncbi:hypothetical protein C8J56DRAFT_243891 [Mycena floridula]|nr:hypothetical protein C8J56DRAFT_243891 [Mycena floridula]